MIITITLDDELINRVIAKSHCQSAPEVVTKVLSDYVQTEPNIIELLAMPEVADLDFNPPRLVHFFSHAIDL
jgi:Arc/MetJ family transcription regulator